jgi:hypothetical protein
VTVSTTTILLRPYQLQVLGRQQVIRL